MTELTREQIERVRALSKDHTGAEYPLFGVSVLALCDMALRTHDAEQRAEQAEAENVRLREALREQECTHWGSGRNVGDCMADGDCHEGCTQAEALATPPEAPGHTDLLVTPESIPDDLGKGDPKVDPEAQQPEGDLAALGRLESYDDDDYCASSHSRWHDAAIVRRHLTTETPCPHVRTSSGGTSYCTLAEAGSGVPCVPDGWKLVPVEPTMDMLKPIASALVRSHGDNPDEPCPPHGEYPRWYGACGGMTEAYRDLLAAAPTEGGNDNG